MSEAFGFLRSAFAGSTSSPRGTPSTFGAKNHKILRELLIQFVQSSLEIVFQYFPFLFSNSSAKLVMPGFSGLFFETLSCG